MKYDLDNMTIDMLTQLKNEGSIKNFFVHLNFKIYT